ncbi:unnamed protein product [Adineta ricciae]|uniref:VOC domain-containing protein n=1 Tax=Adineta ricciae TaxID=249248 RepID=A0A814T1Q1_ADIRI|nr:unnamed protein product [Adineta ricciae]CAF1665660.1 unnamed protein product [Adineta ricciae]
MNFKLAHNILRITNPNEFIQFYLNNFGMQNTLIHNTSYNVSLLGYPTNYDENFNKTSSALPSPTFLELHHADAVTNISMVNSGSVNVYWKMGITLHDVDHAREILQSKGIKTSDPSQFEDIGYVCHLTDPNGFIIELLQHHFQETFLKKHLPEENFPLGYPCCIGQITLQVNDIDKTQRFYGDVLGMKLLSIQEVPRYGFTLYFYAWTDEDPPKSDVISTREWLWKRPYTTIELRYFDGTKQIPHFTDIYLKTK